MALLAIGCGKGPSLTNLRCRQVPCQDPEDPFKLRLQVDFSDDSGTLGAGSLSLYTNGTLTDGVSLADIFQAQGIDSTATSGTLQVDQELMLSSVTEGETFTAGLQARDGQGETTNLPTLSLTLSLGGGN